MLFDEIISLPNLFTAWNEFKTGKRSSEDVQNFERYLEDEIFRLHWELKTKTYRHGTYHRFQIFDPKHRVIHKADVRDRIVHHAIYRILAPIFARSFIFDSYSCRIGKGTHAAVDRLEMFTRKVSRNFTMPCWALKCDIRKFFDSVNHNILFQLIKQKVDDPDTLWLMQHLVDSFKPVDKKVERERASRNSDWKSHVSAVCQRVHERI